MNNLFYLYGLIYISYFLQSLWNIISFDREFVKNSIDEFQEISDKSQSQEEYKSKVKEKVKPSVIDLIFSTIFSILNWAWMIYGTLYAKESTLFGTLLVFSLSVAIIVLIYAVRMVIVNRHKLFESAKGNPHEGIMSLTDKVSDNKLPNVLDNLIRIAIAGFILYSHYYLTT